MQNDQEMREYVSRVRPIFVSAGDAAFTDAAALRRLLTGNGQFVLFDAPWSLVFLIAIYLLRPALAAVIGAVLLVAFYAVSQRLTHGERTVLTYVLKPWCAGLRER